MPARCRSIAPRIVKTPFDDVYAWSRDGLLDLSSVTPGLPILEESMTQLEPGRFEAEAAIVSAGGVLIYRLRINLRSTGRVVLDPAYTAFSIPVSWAGELRINAEKTSSSAMYLTVESNCIYTYGGRREIFLVALPRGSFVERAAALRGRGLEDVRLEDRALEMTPATAARLRRRLATLFEDYCDRPGEASGRPARHRFGPEVWGLVASAYLDARPHVTSGGRSLRFPERIVRRAEERFVAAGSEPISLADLCAAAGVSKSSLYLAFHSLTGTTPLDYFRKRRLMQARSILLQSPPERGVVTRAALRAGLTELGRFAVEYRRLFGESPSATLNRSRSSRGLLLDNRGGWKSPMAETG